MYSGAFFIQQSVGWNLYVSILGLLALTGVCTVTGILYFCISSACKIVNLISTITVKIQF